MRHHLTRTFRILFWCALGFAYVCAIMPGGPELGGSDKNTHVLAFATLAALARSGWPERRAVLIAAALLLFGIFIEASQAIPFIHRDADARDVVADAIGILAGLAAGALALRLSRRFDKRRE